MRLIGTAHCANTEEFDRVKESLLEIEEAEVTTIGSTITVIYEPNGDDKVLDVAKIMADITRVIEGVGTHGLSLMAEKR